MKSNAIVAMNNAETGSLLLDVPNTLFKVPRWLENFSDKEGYKQKSEYHITIIGNELAGKITGTGLAEEVIRLIFKFEWTIKFVNEYIELAKDKEGIHRQSIIQLVTIPELDIFYHQLQIICPFMIVKPPAHITLFTKNYDKGIGLYSDADLIRFTTRLIKA